MTTIPQALSMLIALVLALALALALVNGQELIIERPAAESSLETKLPHGWERLKGNGDLIRATFPVSPYFLIYEKQKPPRIKSPPTEDDPFVEDLASSGVNEPATPPKKLIPARKLLESYGVPFGEGATANYDQMHRSITAVNTREALEMILTITSNTVENFTPLISIRTEIFEVSSLQALQALESAAPEFDHKPERDAILDGVRKGNAKLVASHSLTTAPGQRARVEDTVTFKHSNLTSRGIGTILECEPISSRDRNLSLTISLQHHTAEPEMIETPDKIVSPRFHMKSIATSVNLRDSTYALIGSWKPTGKPEDAEKDIRHLIFVTGSLQDK